MKYPKDIVFVVMRPTYYLAGKHIFVMKSKLKKAKIKEKDLAEKLKITPSYVCAMLNGKKPLNIALRTLLERELNIKIRTGKKEDFEEPKPLKNVIFEKSNEPQDIDFEDYNDL